jgi:hypothetical protein
LTVLRSLAAGSFAACALAGGLAFASPADPAPPAAGGTETVGEALCRLIDRSAERHGLPPGFLARLLWQESSFRAGATSPVGAQGIAQFMPRTAAERGLLDPFDPEQAIPASAAFLAELSRRFGNLGLAAAAYNGGPTRLANWIAGQGGLPTETRRYVVAVTARTVEDWAADAKGESEGAAEPEGWRLPCLALAANLRRPGAAPSPGVPVPENPFAPWGVQLAGNFSKERALASFSRARAAYASVVGDLRPMVIGTRLRSRGTRAFYRVRLPAPSREAAGALCGRIRSAGGACIVLPS